MRSVVYTNKNDCQDCYKCVRNCPVKAISIMDNSASIDDDRCVLCGKCVEVCPVGAQKYRNDEERVSHLLSSDKRVILALAPSFVGEFDVPEKVLIAKIKQAGFWGVSETALGAQLVTYFQRKLLENNNETVFSTACPTFVMLVLKYFPSLKDKLSPLFSPLLAQCLMLRKLYGNEIAIVFAGPCIAKKAEADIHPELLNVAITFDELKNILKKSVDENTDNDKQEAEDACFIPLQSSGGAIYPLDGGMLETITNLKSPSVVDRSFFHYSGIKNIQSLLNNENFDGRNVFCEFLACDGGCVNGSGLSDEISVIDRRNRISDYFKRLEHYSEDEFMDKYAPASIETDHSFCEPVKVNTYTKSDKEEIWRKLGKYREKDFLNCGGCGYDTCDNFAVACLDKRAELEMCVTCMKRQAQNKIRNLMRETPLALCIVDERCDIVECNYKFIEFSMEVDIDVDDEMTQKAVGTKIDRFFAVEDMIKGAFVSKERRTKILHKDDKVFDVLVFPFENDNFAGLMIRDITKPTMKRDVVIDKAQKVIKNNLITVQKIAYLLGETAAETEITLNEIINAYKGKSNE